jgi:DNA repair protein RecO
LKQQVTQAIVLSRTDFGEADRIVTLITPNFGKLSLIARGVRKIKSQLAGGIELFSVSDITFIYGKGELGTLISARLNQHYGNIVKDIKRVQLGYDLIRELNKATEDNPEPEYFELMRQTFAALDDSTVSLSLVDTWYKGQMIRLAGHSPSLFNDEDGQKLDQTKLYKFDLDAMALLIHQQGSLGGDQIKLLRLIFGDYSITAINRVANLERLMPSVDKTVDSIFNTYIKNYR